MLIKVVMVGYAQYGLIERFRDCARAFRGDLSADFSEAVINWKDLDAEAHFSQFPSRYT
ncbi:MAG: hypothetical protein KKD69_03470 [Euryarchaeota archaeon]|nr:hypothetical protein [Euryarchaeota archaeon]MCG2728180.1 hypothetical protein [Candidatus Methanoperedenaceae archaeon]